MGLFDIFKKSPTHVLNYSPAGNSLIIRLSYDTETGKVIYKGRFGTKETFNMNEIDHIVNHKVSETHHVIIVHSQEKVIATFDVLPIIVCQNIEEWLLSKGEIAYDYNEQLRGRWVNLREVDALIKNGPPRKESHPLAEQVNPIPQIDTTKKEDPISTLRELKGLLDDGIITESEFQKTKEKILDSM